MNICKKESCNNFSIARGKYCNEHKTTKRKKDNISKVLIEERQLKEEQNKEFSESLSKDIENQNKLVEKRKQVDIIRERVSDIKLTDSYFTLKIVFNDKNGLYIIQEFNKESTTLNIFDFIDLFIYDNDIIYTNDYSLIVYPNIEIKKTDENKKLINIFNTNKVLLLVKKNEI